MRRERGVEASAVGAPDVTVIPIDPSRELVTVVDEPNLLRLEHLAAPGSTYRAETVAVGTTLQLRLIDASGSTVAVTVRER